MDADGMVRDQHFGEGRYPQSERVISRLLGIERPMAAVEGLGVEAPADRENLRTPEIYLGLARVADFSLLSGTASDRQHRYELPDQLPLNTWVLDGEWTVTRENVLLDLACVSIAFRFYVRDTHLVLTAGAREPISFRVLLDGKPPGRSHGVGVDDYGNGLLKDGRRYQLVRERGPAADPGDHVHQVRRRAICLHASGGPRPPAIRIRRARRSSTRRACRRR